MKIEAFRPDCIIRVSSDFDACSDIFRLFQHMIESIKHKEFQIAFSDGQTLDKSARTAIVTQIEKYTSTIIRFVEEPGPESLYNATV